MIPGFVSNRISHLFMNEAVFVVQDNIVSPQEVDDIFKKCYGHKMGPLETADLIGLDTVVNSLNILYKSYQDPKFRCCPSKSGKGFYEYENRFNFKQLRSIQNGGNQAKSQGIFKSVFSKT
jgi:3-hydroxybutyryl-CoA dehydrogenase